MHVVIMDGGRMGAELASLLIADGHDVTLLESNENYVTLPLPNWMQW